MKRIAYLVACLSLWLTSCEEKVTALHFNEAEQVFEIGKESELRYLNEVLEANPLMVKDRIALTSDTGKEVPAKEACIKLVDDIKISGEWAPIKLSVRELDGNDHTITFDNVKVVIKDNIDTWVCVGLFEEFGGVDGAAIKDLILAGDITINISKEDYPGSVSAGALAGYLKNSHIENCTSKVNISIRDAKGLENLQLGGLIGKMISTNEIGTILSGKIINEGNLTVAPCKDGKIGGVVGEIFNGGKISIKGDVSVENKGDISVQWVSNAESLGNCIGGVFGAFETCETDMEHLHNRGNIYLDTHNAASTFEIGGVCGRLEPGRSDNIYLLDLYNAGNIEIKHDLPAKFSAIGGVIGSFGGSSFHQVVNEGEIILSGKRNKNVYVAGLMGDDIPSKIISRLYSCCEDKIKAYPIWNVENFPLHEICKENH